MFLIFLLGCGSLQPWTRGRDRPPLLEDTVVRADAPDDNFGLEPTLSLDPDRGYGLWRVDVEELRRATRGRTPTHAELRVSSDADPDTCFIASPVRRAFAASAATWACSSDGRPGDGLLGCSPTERWSWRGRADGDAASLPSFEGARSPTSVRAGVLAFDVLADVIEMVAGDGGAPRGWAVAASAPAQLAAVESDRPPELRLTYGDRGLQDEPPPACDWRGYHRTANVHGQSNVLIHGPPGVVYAATGVTVFALDEDTAEVRDSFATFDKVHALSWAARTEPGAEGGILYVGGTHEGLYVLDTDAAGNIVGELSQYRGSHHGPGGGPRLAVEAVRVLDGCPAEGQQARYAYLADGTGVDILDVTRPLMPVRIGEYGDPRTWYSSALAVEMDCTAEAPRTDVYLGRAAARADVEAACPGETEAGACAQSSGACACVWSKLDASTPATTTIEFSSGTNWADVAMDMEVSDGTLLIAGNGGLLTCGTGRTEHGCTPAPRHRLYGERYWSTWLNVDPRGRLVAGYFPEPGGSIAYLGLLSDWMAGAKLPACGSPGAGCGPVRTLWGDNTNDGVLLGDIPSDPAASRYLVSHDDYGIVKVDPSAAQLIRNVIPGGVTASAALDGERVVVADLLLGGAEYAVAGSRPTLQAAWTRPGFERARDHSVIRDVAVAGDLVFVANAEGVFMHPRRTSGELTPLPQPNGGLLAATALAARTRAADTLVFAAIASDPPSIMAWSVTAAGASFLAQAPIGDGPGTTWDLELTDEWLVAAGSTVPLTLLPTDPVAGQPWLRAASCKGWGTVPQLAQGSSAQGDLLFLAADGGLVVTRLTQILALGVGKTCTSDAALTASIGAVLSPTQVPRGVTAVAYDEATMTLLVGYGPAGDHPSDVLAVDISKANPSFAGGINLQEAITSLDAANGLVAVTSPDLGTAVYRAW